MKKIVLCVDRDGLTGGIQISIDLQGSHGYRIAGPKYCGQSAPIKHHILTERDATEIRRYLDMAFPRTSE